MAYGMQTVVIRSLINAILLATRRVTIVNLCTHTLNWQEENMVKAGDSMCSWRLPDSTALQTALCMMHTQQGQNSPDLAYANVAFYFMFASVGCCSSPNVTSELHALHY